MRILNTLEQASDADITAQISDAPRREVMVQLRRRLREHDFRRRVIGAYAATCAVCGLQLNLVEAAHILPVAVDGSTDETSNGIALCALHHRAFDMNLISINEGYQVEVSRSVCQQFKALKLDGGLAAFRRGLRPMIRLPADRRDFPAVQYLRESRRLRGWQA